MVIFNSIFIKTISLTLGMIFFLGLLFVGTKGLGNEINLGNFMANTSPGCTFQITNKSSKILKLGRIRSSCGCAVAVLSENSLNSGESTELKITLKSNSLSGSFSKTLYLETDDSKQKFMRFVLRGNAISLVKTSPAPMLFFGIIETGKVHEYQFVLIPTQAGVELELQNQEYPEGTEVVLRQQEQAWLVIVRVIEKVPDTSIKLKFAVKVKAPTGWPDIEFLLSGKTQSILAESPKLKKTSP